MDSHVRTLLLMKISKALLEKSLTVKTLSNTRNGFRKKRKDKKTSAHAPPSPTPPAKTKRKQHTYGPARAPDAQEGRELTKRARAAAYGAAAAFRRKSGGAWGKRGAGGGAARARGLVDPDFSWGLRSRVFLLSRKRRSSRDRLLSELTCCTSFCSLDQSVFRSVRIHFACSPQKLLLRRGYLVRKEEIPVCMWDVCSFSML
ncbi:hypothetical protein MOQ_008885 [Trypanosoma cruzi marinkellei]|uniref:Uncharacterized protein n=1 Tax=Trypanosoma cruzi marinkellei TaxID=85056 RepID=K2MP10_TRYCR|nr:hypothetical protein MOQ_008885 [Trypanosoma cruzi marinkellei]